MGLVNPKSLNYGLTMTHLDSAAAVFEALGGVAAVAAITDATYRQAWNWKDKDKFPARTYLPLCNALAARGKTAPASLWGMAPRAGRVADARGQE